MGCSYICYLEIRPINICEIAGNLEWKWILKLLLIFALWNNVYTQGPLIYYEGNTEFFCPEDSNEWFPSGGYCHKVIQNVTTWQEASNECAKRSGVAFWVNDSMEIWDISWRLYQTLSSNSDFTNTLFWTGYQFAESSRALTTVCQTETSALSPLWAVGEPARVNTCVAFDVNITDPGRYGWHTVQCQTALPFVCSIRACQKEEFRCHDNSRCISESWSCDGVEDCPDASDEVACAVECGPELLTNLTGSITSPNYPKSSYPDDATCYWHILLPEQYKILLKATTFDTERYHDILFAKDGSSFADWDALPDAFNKSGPLSAERFQYRSATNSLLLKFVSDNSITRPGFLISWEADDSIKNCVPEDPLMAFSVEKELTSPSYDSGQYPFNALCEWVIQSYNRNSVISLQFTDFALAKPDWVKVYQLPAKNQTPSILVDTYTSDHLPYVITSNVGAVKVVFYSDSLKTAKGFALIYKTGCKGLVINATYAYFQSPNSVGRFGELNCEWKLLHPTGKKITFLLQNVTLRGSDSIIINDGESTLVYSNTSTFAPLSSKQGVIIVKFQSSNSHSHFNASFSEDCAPLPILNHGTQSTADAHYGVEIKYSCDTGYKIIGSVNLACGPNGNWTGAAPRCDPILCTAPARVHDAVLQSVTCTPTAKPYSCSAMYACCPGCSPSSFQMQCSDGVWSTISPPCQRASCGPPPPPPPNAVFAVDANSTFLMDDVIEYACQKPYVAIGPTFAVCTATGEWLRSDFNCRLPVCRPSVVAFGRPSNVTQVYYNQSLTDLKCLPGFRQSVPSFQCELTATWLPELSCSDINECDVSNSTICPIGACRNLQGSWMCDCPRGWRWNTVTNHCQDVDECQQSTHECDDDDLCENTHGGYLCHCPPGWMLYNGNNAVDNNVTYLRVHRSCIPVQCPLPVYNSSTTYLFTNHSLFTYKAEILFVCKYSNASATGSEARAVCNEDGRWSVDAPKCAEASCPRPNGVLNGRFEPQFDQGAVILPGTVIEYTCNEKHVLVGQKRRICLQMDLAWSGSDPLCERLHCPDLEPPEGGFVTYESKKNVGATAYFYCDPLHLLGGPEYVQCDDDGRWKGQRPTCQRQKCDTSNLPELVTLENDNLTGVEIGASIQFRCLLEGYVISDRYPRSCVSRTDLPMFPDLSAAPADTGSRHLVKRGALPLFGSSRFNAPAWWSERRPEGADGKLFGTCSVFDITRIASDTYVDEGETVDLTCTIDTDCEGFQITWERGGELDAATRSSSTYSNQNRVTMIQTGARTYTLQIRNAAPNDSGFYWCRVWHSGRVQSQKRVLLQVDVINDKSDRRKRTVLTADKIPPEIVYLYNTEINATGQWTEFSDSSEEVDYALRGHFDSRNIDSIPTAFILESETAAEQLVLRNMSNYGLVERWLEPMTEEMAVRRRRTGFRIRASFSVHRGGFYVALFDNGSICLEIYRVRVYTTACGEFQKGLAYFPRTVAPIDTPANRNDHRAVVVSGRCVEDAEPILPLANVECTVGGHWSTDPFGGSCACKRGYVRMNGACVKRGPICYICGEANSITQCNRRSRLVRCRADEVCSMQLSLQDGFKLSKRCSPAAQCRARIGNLANCTNGWEDCQLCCASDYCNIVPFHSLPPAWNSSLPKCIDAAPPKFINCSTANVTVLLDRYGNIVRKDDGQDDGELPFPVPVARDNSGRVTVTSHPADLWAPAIFVQAATRIMLTARDEANLTATCTFFVVTRRLPPLLQCSQSPINDVIEFSENSGKSARARYPQFNFTDARPVVKRIYDPPQGTMLEAGRPLVVTLTVYDEFGAQDTCHFRYSVSPLRCPAWSLPGYETLSPLPQCTKVDPFGSDSDFAQFRCVIPKNCTQGLWINADSPFAFVCNGSGVWWAEDGINSSNDLRRTVFPPICAPVFAPSLYFTLNVTYALSNTSDWTKATSECIGRYAGVVRAGAIKVLRKVCGKVVRDGSSEEGESDSYATLNLVSSVQNETFVIVLNFTLSSQETVAQSNVLVDCYERFRRAVHEERIFNTLLYTGCPEAAVVTAAADVSGIEECPAGHVKRYTSNFTFANAEETISYVCVKCPPGTFGDSITQECSACPAGTYQSSPGQSSCTPCPNDTSTLYPRSFRVDACIAFCSAGHYSATGLEPCHSCPIGTFQSSLRQQNCTPCPNGTSTSKYGAPAVEHCKQACLPGTYSEYGIEPCFPCPLGFVQSIAGSTSCQKCPNGKTTNHVGATDFTNCIDAPKCARETCANGGTCVPAWPENKCICPAGAFGKRCRRVPGVCDDSNCANRGTCLANGDLNCTCAKGFSGKYCERLLPDETNRGNLDIREGPFSDVDQTAHCGRCLCDGSPSTAGQHSLRTCAWNISYDPCGCNPCILCVAENTVSCKLSTNASSFACACKTGWSGRYCDQLDDQRRFCSSEYCPVGYDATHKLGNLSHYSQPNDSCPSPSPCGNGAQCDRAEERYYCQCKEGYFGYHCQRYAEPCLSFPCENGATCSRNSSDPLGFVCVCPSGWTGSRCREELDLCSSSPCANGGTCYGYFNGFQCVCDAQWTGSTCAEPVDPCAGFPCHSGGSCQDQSGQAHCVCPRPWAGRHCETYTCANPGACPDNATCVQYATGGQCRDKPISRCQEMFCDNGGTCKQNDSYSYTCDCPPGFAGDTCSMVVDACAQNMCQNNATCKPAAAGGYLCFCQLGYLGQYCETALSGCDQDPCKNGGTCTDVTNPVSCICTSLYTGQYCDKAKSQNFNMLFLGREESNTTWIVTSEFTLTEKMNSMTLCFWVRFSDLNSEETRRPMTYLTVVKVQRDKAHPGDTTLLPFIRFTESGLLLNTPGDMDRSLRIDLPVNDTSWHFVCFEWHWSSLEWILYVDGHRFRTNQGYTKASFDASAITQGPYSIVLGQSIDRHQFFSGELSMVTLISAIEFTSPDILKYYTNCDQLLNGDDASGKASLVVRWIDFTQPEPGDPSVRLTYPSVCFQAYCLPNRKTCSTDKIPPEVKYCPKDIAVWSPKRLQVVHWKEPRFADNVEVANVTSNFRNGQLLPWGEYNVVYTAQDRAGNGAYCRFRLYITPFKCSRLDGPTNQTQTTCQTFDHGVYCTVNCTPGYHFTQPIRPFYVCGLEGSYDPLRPDVPVTLPACAPAMDLTNDSVVWTTVEARLEALDHWHCQNESNLAAVRRRITQRLEALNGSNALCGGQHCNFTGAINVSCESSVFLKGKTRFQRAAASEELNDTNDTIITNDSNVDFIDFSLTWRTSNRTLLLELVLYVLRSASPSLFSVASVSSKTTCPPGSVFTDDICVLCSIGTYYDHDTATCLPCPLNTYNSRVGRFNCTECADGQVTPIIGAQFLRDCIDNCTPGYFFDYNTRACTPCSIGLYQGQYGAASCVSCSPGQTTLRAGSTSIRDCDYLCGPGEELDSVGHSCTACPIGTFKAAKNDSACVECPMDYTTSATGSTSESNCTILYCSPGKYKRGGRCVACPVGTYQDQWDQDACKICPPDMITQFPGSGSVWDCKSGGCMDLCGLCSANATCTFDACHSKCTCKPGFKFDGNNTHRCVGKCEGACPAGEMCSLSNEDDAVCRTPINSDDKAISTIVGAASGGFVAIVLIVTLVVIFKVRLYHLVRCCKPPSVKDMSSNQYYRRNTFPAIASQLQSRNRRRTAAGENANGQANAPADGQFDSTTSECFQMSQVRPDRGDRENTEGQKEKTELDMMTPGEVYSAIYEGLRGIRTDRSLSDYLTSASQSTAVFENQCFDVDELPPPSPLPFDDGELTPRAARSRFGTGTASDEDDYFS